MKKLCIILTVLFLFHATTFAESTSAKQPSKMEDREVIYYDFDLDISVENGKAMASWDDFPDNRGFQWYKLVYSTTNSNPVYPDDKVVFIGERLQVNSSFKLDANASYHYIRLCGVVLNDDYSQDRYCGKVQKITTSDSDFVSEEPKKEYVEKTDVKKVEVKKIEAVKNTKTEVQKTKTVESNHNLSLNLRSKINVFLDNFIEKLQKRGDSDEKIVSNIETIIDKLQKLTSQEKYKNIVAYMIQELTIIKEEYSDPLGEFESIFGDY